MLAHDELSRPVALKGNGGMFPVARRHCAPTTTEPAKPIAPDVDDDQVAILERSEAPSIRDSVFHIRLLAQRPGFSDVTQKYRPVIIADDLEKQKRANHTLGRCMSYGGCLQDNSFTTGCPNVVL